jgi:hypothetical protein
LVVRDDAVTRAQGPHLVKPHAFSASHAMDKDDRFACAHVVKRDVDIADLNPHCTRVLSGRMSVGCGHV